MKLKTENLQKGLTNKSLGIIISIKKREERLLNMVVTIKVNGVVVDKDFYSIKRIKEMEKAGFVVESAK